MPPFSLGWPSEMAQSSYYPGDEVVTEEDTRYVSRVLEKRHMLPENTRIAKDTSERGVLFVVKQANWAQPGSTKTLQRPREDDAVIKQNGDHFLELQRICNELRWAMTYASNTRQKDVLEHYVESFKTGDLETYRESQRKWVKDLSPSVENIFGFVEPYRDPAGIRAEFEGIVAIKDLNETRRLERLVHSSSTFIRLLPWAIGATTNDGKGPFEKSLFEPPDFTSLHALAYCSSIIFPGINLPNASEIVQVSALVPYTNNTQYNDIREQHGFKNVIISNRMSAEASDAEPCPFIDPSESATFQKHRFPAYYIWVVLHELLGHGTGQMMCEGPEGHYNFDINDPPVDLITEKRIESWYRPGQTWTGVFGNLATTVDECRAELVGAYLIDNCEILALFGFDENSETRPEDIIYNLYLRLGVDGLRGLKNFNSEDNTWGQAHSRAHFAMLQYLLKHTSGLMKIIHHELENTLTVHVDRSKILSQGKPALGQMLLNLHMYRCTANVSACRQFYEELSKPTNEHLMWRKIVMSQLPPALRFVQGNTFLDDGKVTLKEYATSNEGIIESWYDRRILPL
ncbi:MAG: hypothetical protein M1828_002437 [Chrysothrix sp. TS-e1954]|nr:MAG: hypothetical protein M1828_002437 [Chrysothrix sp. TS-e1954]